MAAKQSIRLSKLLDSWMKDSWQQPGPIQSFLFFYSILSLCHKYFIKKTAAKVRNQELEKGGGGDEWNTNGQAITKVLPHLELNHNSFLFFALFVYMATENSSIKYFLSVQYHVSYTYEATTLSYGHSMPYSAGTCTGDTRKAAAEKAASRINMAYCLYGQQQNKHT